MQPYGCESRQHRHSIFCILPPHILREMARRGSTAQRNAALNAMALDSTHRAQRMTMQLLAVAPSRLVTGAPPKVQRRSEEHTSELQSLRHLVCRLLLEKKKKKQYSLLHDTKKKKKKKI